jgi:hypothetical protein
MCKAKPIAPVARGAALAVAAAVVSAGLPAPSSAQSESGATAAPSTERLERLVRGARIGHPNARGLLARLGLGKVSIAH